MLSHQDLISDLPPKILCLTFDDGPGKHTQGVAQYLHEQGISATFFVVGERARWRRDDIRFLIGHNHLVANHTYSHPNLLYSSFPATDMMEGYLALPEGARKYFRPPYGAWQNGNGGSVLSKKMAWLFADLVGPVMWDIDTGDWRCWYNGLTSEQCAHYALEKIDEVGRGIVLTHDDICDPVNGLEKAVAKHQQPLAMLQCLIPELKKRGYQFVRLDKVELKERA